MCFHQTGGYALGVSLGILNGTGIQYFQWHRNSWGSCGRRESERWRSKNGILDSMGMQIEFQLNLSFSLKLRWPLLLKSPDPLHPVTGGLNQEIEVGFEP